MEEKVIKDNNVSAEICFLGALMLDPDLMVSYSNFMRSKYDFADPVTKFFYDSFETYYLTFSQTLDETKMNVFMSQNEERLSQYKKYKGWKTIERFMELADVHDVKNYYNTVKKYSLIREYGRNGFPIERILTHKNFDKMSPADIYRIIRTKADKINTVINAGEEAVDLTKGTSLTLEEYLNKPDFGVPYPWAMYNEYFLGMREGKIFLEGLVSNAGKSRKLMFLAAHTALVLGHDFLVISNEMSEKDLKDCLIATVVNNKEFQELHGVTINKPEKEIKLGIYHDDDGEIIRREIDENGIYIETLEDFKNRVKSCKEYQAINKVTNWIDNSKNKVMFKDVCDDYSTNRIEFELRKAKMVYGIKFYGYDTLKGYLNDEWSALKQTATRLKEITNELQIYGHIVFQMTDDSVFIDIFQLSSNNISTSKGIKHVCDMLTLGKLIDKEEYHKYLCVPNNSWGQPVGEPLDLNCKYLAVKIDKNRAGDKDRIVLFKINLNYNTWENVGYLIRAKK